MIWLSAVASNNISAQPGSTGSPKKQWRVEAESPDLLRRSSNGQTRLFDYETDRVVQPAVLTPLDEDIRISTNDAATWTLDAIFMLEVLPTIQ